ncbi:uncharacterized protein LOC133315404 [Gastrolobium bilobum]|uniref:uncharacterized protein LOC133315404 n=1 Tax=Gastrolobium bilobum TaxID=150636 RepID=UPI002AB2B801|nr:uncharacterized protein LOC133315404 [Gastrolobium bilobum]XP_061373007.1 uncharacterized protein LOC133315404 [Gastrolobium bilobum]XP_061373008.1 uncharacterized protein LOC133315404 [Gastrolobium bilobum]
MSRCFPFPPPGYEKKARTDEVDLFKKEKQREKKRKKDKRDKEKRESKEKREKEGRDGKHKEKDRKEKNREKKKDKGKDKGRDRDKSKSRTADDKGFPGQGEGPNAGKLHQKEIKQNDKKGILFENKLTKQYNGNNGEKARENNHLAEENKDSKFLLELERRIKDDNGGAGNQLVQKFTNTDHRKDEGTVRLVAKGSGPWPDGKEKLNDKGLDAKKIDGKGIRAEVRPIGNATVQNHAGNFHPRVDGMAKLSGNFHPTVDGMSKLLGKYFDRNLEATVEGKGQVKEKKYDGEEKVEDKKDGGREKVKEKEKKDDKLGDKRKDKEKEKKGHGKDKDRDKEKKKEEKAKEHTELKTTEQNKLKESNKVGPIGSNSFARVSSNSDENAVSRENLKKRKDIESNGVPRANDNWPSKLARSSSSHTFTENGRILEPCQISIPNASDKPGVVATSVKVDNKEFKINGVIEARPFAVSSNKTHLTATVPANLVTEASAKLPHPDTKYLSQVYSVPKVEEWSGFDDQDWLFGKSSILQERKPVVESSEVGETLQVWSEGLHIETADVFALPYVIPY